MYDMDIAEKRLGTSYNQCFNTREKVQMAWARGCICEFLKWDTRIVQIGKIVNTV